MSLRAFCACQGVKNTVHKYHVSQRWWIYRLATTTRSVPDPAGCFCCLPGKTPWQKRNIGQDGSKPLQASLRRLLRSSWHSFQLPFVTEWRDTDIQILKYRRRHQATSAEALLSAWNNHCWMILLTFYCWRALFPFNVSGCERTLKRIPFPGLRLLQWKVLAIHSINADFLVRRVSGTLQEFLVKAETSALEPLLALSAKGIAVDTDANGMNKIPKRGKSTWVRWSSD